MSEQDQRFYIEVGSWEIVRTSGRPQVILRPGRSLADLQEPPVNPTPGTARTTMMRAMLESGLVKNRAELAKQLGISRARVSQILGSTKSRKEARS